MTTETLLKLLAQSQQLLNEVTRTENEKRVRIRQASLKQALELCAQSAEDGYRQASDHLHSIGRIIEQAEETIQMLRTPAPVGKPVQENNPIYQQIEQARADMSEAHKISLDEIEANYQRLGTFNIVLFGRTMTGKSTLMEILTKGNGRSIGKGAQRTTRDVRSYEWNGLKITDVPGIAAFEGFEDEQTAAEAARQADLIIFLITDDAPQPAEAEQLAILRNIGNPMLGICNVKRAVDDELHRRIFLRDQEKIFDNNRLNEMVNEFQQMVNHKAPGSELDFKYAHLKLRFMAEQPEHLNRRVELTSASRFAEIEDHISREVTDNGPLHRQRTFLESATRASYDVWQQMLTASQYAYELHDRIRDHAKETRTWQKQFRRSANTRINALLKNTIGKLRADIPAFVEINCENEALSKQWERKVQQADINKPVRQFQEELQQQCYDKVKTLIEEIGQELHLLEFAVTPPHLKTGNIYNHRRAWDWTIQGISAVLGAAATASLFTFPPLAIPLGIAAGIVQAIGMIFRRMFGNKAKRRREAIEKITPQLHQSLDELEYKIKRELRQWLDNELIGQQINKTISQLETIASSAEEAAGFYQDQAQELNQRQLELNGELLRALLNHTGEDPSAANDIIMARVPGQTTTLKTSKGLNLTQATLEQLESVLQEPIEVIPNRWSHKQVIQWATGHRADAPAAVSISEKRKVAHTQYSEQDPATPARVNIAQQLTGLHIINSSQGEG